jgi:hypothetical protein
MSASEKTLTCELRQVQSALAEKERILRQASNEFLDLKRQETELRVALRTLATDAPCDSAPRPASEMPDGFVTGAEPPAGS